MKAAKKPWVFNKVGPIPNALISALFIALALGTLLPLVFVVVISFSSEASIVAKGYSFIPMEWSTAAYDYLLDTSNYIGRAFVNSIGITITGTLLGLMLISTLGYTISRPSFRLRGVYTAFIFIPMMFSGGLVSTYMVNTQVFGLKNTYLALILPGACSTWYAIIMRTFFQTTIPDSIIESGKIDGASQLRIFVRLVLPISLPVIATIGLFLTFAYWNAWYGAMLYLDSSHRDLYPLQYVLVSIQNSISFMARNEEYFTSEITKTIPTESSRMAIVTVVVLPIACSYPFFQRYFINGLTIGAVKG
ncbi:MAG: carbohydrate ABC transporter permease [Oscillospiraceae bacterium]|jgi:putative aldouronate transport system permease protein|nr:carbohydrate ABC transporter permease [Oscillospiraceae bacterium]